jgi:hypothetical protein
MRNEKREMKVLGTAAASSTSPKHYLLLQLIKQNILSTAKGNLFIIIITIN